MENFEMFFETKSLYVPCILMKANKNVQVSCNLQQGHKYYV